MFTLDEKDVVLNQSFANKKEAITFLANRLIEAGVVKDKYDECMLDREAQNATYLGNGIAIPHGTTDRRDDVLQTGVKVIQMPEGVVWGDTDEVAYLAIAIAANSTEHLQLLKRLTRLLGDDTLLPTLRFCTEPNEIIALLNDEAHEKKSQPLAFNVQNVVSEVQGDNPQALVQALSALFVQEAYVQQNFASSVTFENCLHLGHDIWLVASSIGVRQPTFGIVDAQLPFEFKRKTMQTLIVIATRNDQHLILIKQLAGLVYRNEIAKLKSSTPERVESLLLGKKPSTSKPQAPVDSAIEKTCTITNTHGLHTRPASVLVKIAKGFHAKVEIANAQAPEQFVSAQSLMKVISLGVGPGGQVVLRAQGDDAAQALDTLAENITAGLK